MVLVTLLSVQVAAQRKAANLHVSNIPMLPGSASVPSTVCLCVCALVYCGGWGWE